MSTRLHISLPGELVARVDELRGDVPRSAWLRRLVERELYLGPGREGNIAAALRRLNEREAVERASGVGGETGASAVSPEPGISAPAEQLGRRHAGNCKCPVCS